MKAIQALVCAFCLFIAATANAQAKPATGSFEYQGGYEKSKPVVNMLDAYIEKQAWGKIGVSAFVLMTKTWAEAYAGPVAYLAEWMSVSASFGAQQIEDRMGIRYAASLWLGGGKKVPLQFLGAFEGDETAARDRSGLWYDAKALYTPWSWLAVGVHGRRFIGLGPRLEVTIPVPQVPLTLWATWNPYDPESKNEHASLARGIVGAKACF